MTNIQSVRDTGVALRRQRAQAAGEGQTEAVDTRGSDLRKLESRIVLGFLKPVKGELNGFPRVHHQ